MNESSDLSGKSVPSIAALGKGSAIAVLTAAAILVFFVLPAEYGIDVTGVGARIGLTAMSADGADEAEEESAPSSSVSAATESVEEPVSALNALWKSNAPFQEGEMSLTLKPNEGGEIKALMTAGERLVFSWESNGPVNFDMHGEELNAEKDEFTSYWKGRNEQHGHGAFVAPFAGTHGWYWRNRGAAPVTVKVRASGYYEKLFKP
jgi:hypothetical protein